MKFSGGEILLRMWFGKKEHHDAVKMNMGFSTLVKNFGQ